MSVTSRQGFVEGLRVLLGRRDLDSMVLLGDLGVEELGKKGEASVVVKRS